MLNFCWIQSEINVAVWQNFWIQCGINVAIWEPLELNYLKWARSKIQKNLRPPLKIKEKKSFLPYLPTDLLFSNISESIFVILKPLISVDSEIILIIVVSFSRKWGHRTISKLSFTFLNFILTFINL